MDRDLLNFARVMVEVFVKQDFPDTVEFLDEWGYKVSQEVQYEWKPIHCSNCGGMAHDTEKCKHLLGVRKQWVPKTTTPVALTEVQTDSEGSIAPKNPTPARQIQITTTAVEMGNPFQSLNTLDNAVNKPHPTMAGSDQTMQ